MSTELLYVEVDDRVVIYLTAQDVLRLYARLFDCSAEEARDQVRDLPGLEAAVHRPETYAHYEHADIPLQAAVLAHGIGETQHFIEGNKRTGLAAMALFLDLNGYWITASQDQRATWMVGLSSGMSVETLAKHIRENSTNYWGH